MVTGADQSTLASLLRSETLAYGHRVATSESQHQQDTGRTGVPHLDHSGLLVSTRLFELDLLEFKRPKNV